MNNEINVNEYAKAVYELVIEEHAENKIREDLLEIINAFNDNSEFYKIITSNNLSKEDKKKMISKIFKNKVNIIIFNFTQYLIDQSDEKLILLIINKIISFLDKKMSILNAKIFTPFQLNDKDIKKIENILKDKTNKKIISEIVIDPNLIGGIRIEYDSHYLDNSIDTKLKEIKLQMKRGK